MNELIKNKQEFLTKLRKWQQYEKSRLTASVLIGCVKSKYAYYPVFLVKNYGITCANLMTTNGESGTFWDTIDRPEYQVNIFDIPTPTPTSSIN